jgi:cystathionine beta-lyase
VGRIWTAEELGQLIAICRKYNVLVVSDEIWSDLALWGLKHIPLGILYPENVRY